MSNLLEKASILTTPTAYNDGKLLSVKPIQTFGSELVTNGDFATDSDWSKGGNWSIGGGVATANGNGNGNISQNIPLTVGTSYSVTYTVVNASVGSRIGISTNATSIQIERTENGTYTETFTASLTSFYIRALWNNGNSVSIDNVSVKEVIDGDFDFTRNSSATRVASNGLIEDVQILSGNLVTNGDFSQEGAELVTNGGFATDSDWTLGSNWSILNGIATSNGSGLLQQSTSQLTSGKTYKAFFEITEYTSGGVKLYSGSGSDTSTYQNTVGTHVFYFVANGSTTSLYSNNFIGSIDNVSVKEVGQHWTLGSGWSIGDSKAVFSDTANGDIRTSSNIFTANSKYKISLTVSDLTSGTAFFGIGAGAASNLVNYDNYTNGDYSFEVTAPNGLGLRIYATTSSGSSFSIGNISVKEITDDTNLPRIDYDGFSYQDILGSELVTNGSFDTDLSGWLVTDSATGIDITWTVNGVSFITDGTGGGIQQSVLTVGKSYLVEFDYTAISGAIKMLPYFADISETKRYSQYITATTTSISFYRKQGNTEGLIDNVSVKEVLGQEVVPDSGVGHILLEPQSTNLVTQSEDFSDASWSKSNVTMLSNQVISPDGTLNAFKTYPNSSGNYRNFKINPLAPASGLYTFSIFAKAAELEHLVLIDYDASGSGIDFNLSTGVATDNSTSGFDSFDMVDYGNGWYRCIATSTNGYYYWILSDNGGLGVTANGTDGVYIFGGQAEALSFATSYIPTSGSTVTRLGETLNNSGSSDLINSTEGVLYVEIRKDVNPSTFSLISLNNAASNSDANSVTIGFEGGSDFYLRVKSPNGTFTSQTIQASNNEFHKIAIRYEQGNVGFFINGVKETFYTGSWLFTLPLDNLSFDYNGNGTLPFYGKAKCVAVYKEALTDAELTCLTTI